MDAHDRLTSLYDAFNRRDVDAVLAALAPDVAWPNGWEGGWVHGREAVGDYWRRQWAEIDPHVTPAGFEERAGGRVAVTVDQVVRGRDGALLAEERVVHVYRFDGAGLITEMAIEA